MLLRKRRQRVALRSLGLTFLGYLKLLILRRPIKNHYLVLCLVKEVVVEASLVKPTTLRYLTRFQKLKMKNKRMGLVVNQEVSSEQHPQEICLEILNKAKVPYSVAILTYLETLSLCLAAHQQKMEAILLLNIMKIKVQMRKSSSY